MDQFGRQYFYFSWASASTGPDACILLASKANNTQRQYKNAFNLFCKFCLSFNITITLPASDTSVSVYLIHLTNAGKSASTINEAFCVISWAHRLTGLADPCKSDLVKTIREGSIRSVGRCVDKKEPITPEILRQLVKKNCAERREARTLLGYFV